MRNALSLVLFVALPAAAALSTGACKSAPIYEECFGPTECATSCSGPVTISECGPCPDGTRSKFDLGCPRPLVDAAPPSPPDCRTGECVRAVTCRGTCDGPIVQSGCCPCPTGSFDDFACKRDGSADSAPSDAASTSDAADATPE